MPEIVDQETVMLIESNCDELDVMKRAMVDIDNDIHCMSFVYADDAISILRDDLEKVPDYIFLDVDVHPKTVTECMTDLSKIKAASGCKIIVFAPVMPRRVAFVYRIMGANYAFQKPLSGIGYKHIFSRIFKRSPIQS